MDYEKLYKEALERAKYALTTDMDKSGHWAVNYIFPTLKESEDEKIRKELISFVNNDGWKFTKLTKEEKESWISWIEKQSKENMIEALRLEYEKGKSDALQEQRKEWNEEDERIHQCLIRDQEKALDDVRNDKYGHSEIISDLKEMYRERIGWLKSLKERLKGE